MYFKTERPINLIPWDTSEKAKNDVQPHSSNVWILFTEIILNINKTIGILMNSICNCLTPWPKHRKFMANFFNGQSLLTSICTISHSNPAIKPIGFNANLQGCESIVFISRSHYGNNKQHFQEGKALMPISYSQSLTSLEKDIKSNVTSYTYNINMSLPFNQFPLD